MLVEDSGVLVQTGSGYLDMADSEGAANEENDFASVMSPGEPGNH